MNRQDITSPLQFREDKIFRKESGDALGQGIEFLNDMSESQLISLIKEKKMPAIATWLKNNHPRYGSKTKSYTPIISDEELTPDDKKLIADALALVSGISKNHEQ